MVIDVDPRHGGDESFAALERGREIPLTWRALTGGGGEHVLFACPDGVHISNVAAELFKPPVEPPLGRGIDVRARGGYIVAPPSRHISGRSYAWSVDHHPHDVPLAPAPDWLITRLTSPRSTATSPEGAPAEPIPSDIWAQLTRQPIAEYRDAAAARCAVPECRGISHADATLREALWDRFFTAASSSVICQRTVQVRLRGGKPICSICSAERTGLSIG